MTKILVCGGRNYKDQDKVNLILNKIHDDAGITCIVQGGAKGADELAKNWAERHNIECKEYKADWDAYGRSAGPIRNREMFNKEKPDMVVAFPGGKGTAHMASIAEGKVPVIKVGYGAANYEII